MPTNPDDLPIVTRNPIMAVGLRPKLAPAENHAAEPNTPVMVAPTPATADPATPVGIVPIPAAAPVATPIPAATDPNAPVAALPTPTDAASTTASENK
jgi:hypothetical protein